MWWTQGSLSAVFEPSFSLNSSSKVLVFLNHILTVNRLKKSTINKNFTNKYFRAISAPALLSSVANTEQQPSSAWYPSVSGKVINLAGYLKFSGMIRGKVSIILITFLFNIFTKFWSVHTSKIGLFSLCLHKVQNGWLLQQTQQLDTGVYIPWPCKKIMSK